LQTIYHVISCATYITGFYLTASIIGNNRKVPITNTSLETAV
jgi:hypothetical protein